MSTIFPTSYSLLTAKPQPRMPAPNKNTTSEIQFSGPPKPKKPSTVKVEADSSLLKEYYAFHKPLRALLDVLKPDREIKKILEGNAIKGLITSSRAPITNDKLALRSVRRAVRDAQKVSGDINKLTLDSYAPGGSRFPRTWSTNSSSEEENIVVKASSPKRKRLVQRYVNDSTSDESSYEIEQPVAKKKKVSPFRNRSQSTSPQTPEASTKKSLMLILKYQKGDRRFLFPRKSSKPLSIDIPVRPMPQGFKTIEALDSIVQTPICAPTPGRQAQQMLQQIVDTKAPVFPGEDITQSIQHYYRNAYGEGHDVDVSKGLPKLGLKGYQQLVADYNNRGDQQTPLNVARYLGIRPSFKQTTIYDYFKKS